MNTQQWLKKFEDALIGVSRSMSGLTIKQGEILGNTASQIVTNQMQADAQRKESDLAYKRSLPTNQVRNLVNAGMSRAGAINTLNGGGSYTPAPISATSPSPGSDIANSRQIDSQNVKGLVDSLNSFAGNITNIGQMQLQERQLNEQKRQFDASLREQQRQFNSTFSETKRMNDSQIRKLGIDTELAELESDVLKATKDGTIKAINKESLARTTAALLNNLQSQKILSVIANMSDEQLQWIFDLQAYTSMIQRGLNFDAPRMVLQGLEKLAKFIF